MTTSGVWDPITDGDTSAAVVFRLVDSDGSVWRSSPYVLANCLYWTLKPGTTNEYHNILRVSTLRHLMAGATAQIEIYIGQVDLQLFDVYPNDPTVDYIDVQVDLLYDGTLPDASLGTGLQGSVAARPVGEDLYTTGGALPNMPPPLAQAIYVWRQRAFAAYQSTIYPSQEFSVGLGIQWNQDLRSEWSDGSGDITGICHIDWNYLAVFKKDAIAIISGPGPDGLAHGNYILQTLSTKAGCTNVKSLVNGADGCYYQDAATGRPMLLSADLQIKECAPGAFDYAGRNVSCALHVEAARQVWFFFDAVGSGNSDIIVLDYKHRTESSPMGSVYVWPLAAFSAVRGAAIRAGQPELLLFSGNTFAQVANQWYDLEDDGTTKHAILRELETGDMNPIGLQRQFHCSRVQVLGEWIDAHTMALTVNPNFGTSATAATIDLTAAPGQFGTRPANCMRAQSVRMKLAESLYSTPGTPPVPVYGAGSKWVGFALEVQDCGKLVNLDVGRII